MGRRVWLGLVYVDRLVGERELGSRVLAAAEIEDQQKEMYAKRRVKNLQMRSRCQCGTRTRYRGSQSFLQGERAVKDPVDEWWLDLFWARGRGHSDRITGARTGSGLDDTDAAPLLSTDRVEGGWFILSSTSMSMTTTCDLEMRATS